MTPAFWREPGRQPVQVRVHGSWPARWRRPVGLAMGGSPSAILAGDRIAALHRSVRVGTADQYWFYQLHRQDPAGRVRRLFRHGGVTARAVTQVDPTVRVGTMLGMGRWRSRCNGAPARGRAEHRQRGAGGRGHRMDCRRRRRIHRCEQRARRDDHQRRDIAGRPGGDRRNDRHRADRRRRQRADRNGCRVSWLDYR